MDLRQAHVTTLLSHTAAGCWCSEPPDAWLLHLHTGPKRQVWFWAIAQNHLWEAPRLPQSWHQLFGRNLLHPVVARLMVELKFRAKLQALSWCSRMVLLWAEPAQQWEGKNLKQIVPRARQWVLRYTSLLKAVEILCFIHTRNQTLSGRWIRLCVD